MKDNLLDSWPCPFPQIPVCSPHSARQPKFQLVLRPPSPRDVWIWQVGLGVQRVPRQGGRHRWQGGRYVARGAGGSVVRVVRWCGWRVVARSRSAFQRLPCAVARFVGRCTGGEHGTLSHCDDVCMCRERAGWSGGACIWLTLVTKERRRSPPFPPRLPPPPPSSDSSRSTVPFTTRTPHRNRP